jgi:undecaprenyl diphosphate synthase
MHKLLAAQPDSAAAQLERELIPGALPKHVAVIADGNGRWGVGRGMPRTYGHRESVEAVRRCVTAADDLGVKYLSLFCFSTENTGRPEDEVGSLFKLFDDVLDAETQKLHKKNVRIITTGMLELLPAALSAKFDAAVARTAANDGLQLNLCVMYSGRSELLAAMERLVHAVQDGTFVLERLNERSFRQFLFHPEVPDPDLVIRTSGEMRISNFLLWQMAYPELVFTEVLWPDFSRADFLAALVEYQNRNRRYGKVQ